MSNTSGRELSVQQVAELMTARTGVAIAASTVWRWCVKGVGGVRLEHGRVGRRYFVTEGALARFEAALKADAVKRATGKAKETEERTRRPRRRSESE